MIGEIYGIFERHTGVGALEPVELTRNSKTILDVSNRLLTPRRDAPSMRAVPFANGVDPRGLLTAIVSKGDYVHGEDNAVCYFICCMEEGVRRLVLNYSYETPLTLIRFEPTELHIFHIGDIVEVQISVVVTPGRDGSHKMRTILRLIALIDGRFSQVNDLNHASICTSHRLRRRL